MDILISLAFVFLGAIIAGFGVWCYMHLWGPDKKENDRLKIAKQHRDRVFDAHQQVGGTFRRVGWKFSTSFLLFPLRLVIARKLVSGGTLIAEFYPDEHHLQIGVLLPPTKIPPQYKDQRAEAGIESALWKSPQFRVYQVSEYSGTAWTEIAKRVVEAVETYERNWNEIRPRIREVNRLLMNAVREEDAFRQRLKNEEAAFRARLDESLKKIGEAKAVTTGPAPESKQFNSDSK